MSGALEPGSRIGDGLVVRRVIGHGASATVYEAEHLDTGGAVAVKVVHASREPHHLARFEREAQICGRVRSPHVPQVYDVGRIEDGSPYLVMELLYGEALDSLVRRGPLPFEQVFEIGHQLLCALEAVHGQRAIHRDVKPENLLVAHDAAGRLSVKLVDFGISKTLDEPRHVTIEGMVLGTPHYMAPEQVEGLPLDERVDSYAAGAVIYEMVTGRTPFSGRTADEVMMAVQRDPIIPPAVLRDGCPVLLDALIVRAMSRSPDDRFPSAGSMRVALDEARRTAERQSEPVPLVRRKDRVATVPPPPRPFDEARATVRVRPPAALRAQALAAASDLPDRVGRRWAVAAVAALLVLGGMGAAATIAGLDAPDHSVAPAEKRATTVRDEPSQPPRLEATLPGRLPFDDPVVADRQTVEDGEHGSPASEAKKGGAARDRPRARAPLRAPVTTVEPKGPGPDELRKKLRDRVREAMLRHWPQDGDEAEDDRPSLLRENPYEVSPAASTEEVELRGKARETTFGAASH